MHHRGSHPPGVPSGPRIQSRGSLPIESREPMTLNRKVRMEKDSVGRHTIAGID